MTKKKKAEKPRQPIDILVGKNVQKYRLEKKNEIGKPWSQERLAKEAELEKSLITKIENGIKGVGNISLPKLAKALGKPEWAFFIPFPFDPRLARILEGIHLMPRETYEGWLITSEIMVGVPGKPKE